MNRLLKTFFEKHSLTHFFNMILIHIEKRNPEKRVKVTSKIGRTGKGHFEWFLSDLNSLNDLFRNDHFLK